LGKYLAAMSYVYYSYDIKRTRASEGNYQEDGIKRPVRTIAERLVALEEAGNFFKYV
jgi:hypothetical protein